MSLPSMHEKIRSQAVEQLSILLGADVSIRHLNVLPINRVELADVSIAHQGDTLLTASALNAGVSMRNLLRGRIVITDVELMHPDIRLWRDSIGAPLNVDPVIARLKGDGKNKPAKFNLAVHTVVIRSGRVRYEVINAPEREGLDPNHISVNDLNADITAPKVSNAEVRVNLKRMNFEERSGLNLRNLSAEVVYTPEHININGLSLSLQHTMLSFADMTINPQGSGHIADIALLAGSRINPADLAPLYAPLKSIDESIGIEADADLYSDSLSVRSLAISSEANVINASLRGEATARSIASPQLAIELDAPRVSRILGQAINIKPQHSELLAALGKVTVNGTASWRKPTNVELDIDISTAAGNISVDASGTQHRISGVVDAGSLNVGLLLPNKDLGLASISSSFELTRRKGTAALTIDALEWRHHCYRNIDIAGEYQDRALSVNVTSTDSLAQFEAHMAADFTPGAMEGELAAEITNFAPAEMGLWHKYPGYSVKSHINAEFTASEPMRPNGQLRLTNFSFTDAAGNGFQEAPITLSATLDGAVQRIALTSDIMDLKAEGQINPASIGATVNNILAQALPSTFLPRQEAPGVDNDFRLTGTIHQDSPLLRFAKLPVKLLYGINIDGSLHQSAHQATLSITAPYIQQGDKLIEHSALSITAAKQSRLSVTTAMPSKFGMMNLELSSLISGGEGHASFRLNNPGEDAYSGCLGMNYRPSTDGVDVEIEESTFNLGEKDMTWQLLPSLISYHGSRAVINGLTLRRDGQSLDIWGAVSKSHDDEVTVNLQNINLDNVFEALRMNAVVQFGGTVTGTITGAGLLSAEPILQTNDLTAINFSYAHCPMGNAAITARWNNETRGIELHADVEGNVADGRTVVDGVIKPMTQELDFRFHAKHTPVGFLHTFMEAWASKVGGYASGDAHLWGTFKYVELEGNMYAENFALTVDYTNVTYFATDSVRIKPGIIKLDDMMLRDATGRTALLNGQLTHNKFQDPKFHFRISNIDRLLAYDRPITLDNFWGGTIRANGTVDIDGRPGRVAIGAVVSTAPGSDFTIELSDKKQAAEYNFLTFRDITPRAKIDTTELRPGSAELDRIMRGIVAKRAAAQATSIYDFGLQVKVTPDVKMTAIMDPVADDRIVAYGTGDIGIQYSSQNDEMRLDGTFRLNQGEYNFSLQDIIRKNFTIKPGSSITFKGDPYDAKLDIAATYQRHANLSDLDETFLTDKEVQRTSVPVNAVLLVTGSIESPDIDFDLEFPTLTNSDVPRKVKSIVNTKEMMQQQIIYLLALDRFYTPEYMSATKGNELMSVASGTISSQLSNILGQLSDKVSVAPSLRSDAGDFSDMEVDVALSSTLLNNRLLLNGNFGYRDNSLNTATTQFVGDLDVEYLLNRAGNWRLKAYNHFNDRNLYVKTALTTQGIGLVFRHDFDHIFRKKKSKE